MFCTGSHTGENIAEALRGTKKRWGFGDAKATTDSAANEKKAFEILEWTRIPCIGHNINLVVKAALSVSQVSRVLGKMRSGVTYLHKSPLATGVYKQKQALLLPPDKHHKLISDCKTRWNSAIDMGERYVEQTPVLHACAADPKFHGAEDLKKKLLNYEEQHLVELIIKVLKPFKIATVLLSSETEPTLSKVLPTLIKLDKAIEDQEDDPKAIRDMKAAMREKFLKIEDPVAKKLYKAASLIDPRTKQLSFLSSAERSKAKADLVGMLENQESVKVKEEPVEKNAAANSEPTLPQLPVKEEPELEPPPKKMKQEADDWLDDIISTKIEPATKSLKEQIEEEIDRFIAEPVVHRKGEEKLDPLKWWASHEVLYPRISRLAKQILAMPASSVPSERIFSLAGNIVNKKRSQLKPENLDLLIFLKKNT